MPTKNKELDAQLQDLAGKHAALAETVHRLATHTAVLAAALRDSDAVPSSDLDEALIGINELLAGLPAPS